MIHVVLADIYPNPSEARSYLTATDQHFPPHTPYSGLWHIPTPEHTLVHAFTHQPDETLQAAGWTREATP